MTVSRTAISSGFHAPRPRRLWSPRPACVAGVRLRTWAFRETWSFRIAEACLRQPYRPALATMIKPSQAVHRGVLCPLSSRVAFQEPSQITSQHALSAAAADTLFTAGKRSSWAPCRQRTPFLKLRPARCHCTDSVDVTTSLGLVAMQSASYGSYAAVLADGLTEGSCGGSRPICLKLILQLAFDHIQMLYSTTYQATNDLLVVSALLSHVTQGSDNCFKAQAGAPCPARAQITLIIAPF